MVGTFVFPEVTVGIIAALTTLKLSTPMTLIEIYNVRKFYDLKNLIEEKGETF